jgi:FkbM family methyltransferase
VRIRVRHLAHQLLPPIVVSAIRHAKQRSAPPDLDYEDLELKRLNGLPRMQPAITNVLGWPFHVVDGMSFVHLYDIFFKQELYRFSTVHDKPFIIDCGANIGVSVALWKVQFPNCRVLAFEADPDIFQILQKNCSHLPGVKLINAAVWDREGQVPFLSKGAIGGHLAEFSQYSNAGLARSVPCVRLRPFLATQCDLLKMDIEGAEVEVIRDCSDVLTNVARIFVEYHSFTGHEQRLGETILFLERAGFRLHIHTELPSPRPFDELIVINEKDLRLDLFCFKESTRPKAISQD